MILGAYTGAAGTYDHSPLWRERGSFILKCKQPPPKKRGKLFIFIILEYKQMSPEDTSLYISGFQGLCYSNMPLGLKI